MAKEVIYTCDDPADKKKGSCPEGAGKVEERTYRFGKYEYTMDLCNDKHVKFIAYVNNFLWPAVEQKRVALKDTVDYKLLAAKWWANQPGPKKKHGGFSKGAFSKTLMEAFEGDFSDWENWHLGDDIPKDWKYDEEEESMEWTGEGKLSGDELLEKKE